MESFQFRSLSMDAMETCFPTTDNELVNSLSEHFFISGSIQMNNLPEVMEVRVAIVSVHLFGFPSYCDCLILIPDYSSCFRRWWIN